MRGINLGKKVYFFLVFLAILFIHNFWVMKHSTKIDGNVDTLDATSGLLVDNNVFNDHGLNVILRQPVSRRFAVISANLINNSFFFYIFYIPSVCLAWRRIGYEPIILIVESKHKKENELEKKALGCLRRLNMQIIYIDTPADYETITGMIARIFVGILPDRIVTDDDYILTTDSDIMPIKKDFFNFYNTEAISVLNAFNIGKVYYQDKVYDMFPMSYIGMRKWQWREVMGLKNYSQLKGIIKNTFDCN